jgi:hypothetical protein
MIETESFTVEQVKELRGMLEREMLSKLAEFEQNTGVTVESVLVHHVEITKFGDERRQPSLISVRLGVSF